MTHRVQDRRWAVGLSLAASILGWGWAWVGIRAAVEHFPAGPLALGRYLVASLVLLPFWWRGGARWPARTEWPRVGLMGFFGFTLYNLFINIGEKTITAGTGALIAASIPVMLTLGACLWFGERLRVSGWVGVFLALGGVGIITLGAEGGFRFSSGAALVLAASVCAAGYGLLSKELLARHRPLDVTTWAVWTGTIGLVPTGLGLPGVLRVAPAEAVWTMIWLGVIPGALCYSLWSFVVSHMPLSKASSWQFFFPVVSIGLGWIILGEVPAPLALLGGLVTLAGVYLVNTKGRFSGRQTGEGRTR